MGATNVMSYRDNPRDMEYEMKATLEDFFNGSGRKIAVQRFLLCDICDGSGLNSRCTEIITLCEGCSGTGQQTDVKKIDTLVYQTLRKCRICSGQGMAIFKMNRCGNCNGKKFVRERSVIDVDIKKGMKTGQRIVYEGEGNQEMNKVIGDIIISLKETKHPVYTRRKNDLFMVMTLELVEALCGFVRVVKTLDRRKLRITIPPGQVVKSGDIKYVNGEGMPFYKNESKKGRLVIQFEVNMPKTIPYRHLFTVEKCLPPRDITFIPIDALEGIMVDMTPAEDDRDANQDQSYHDQDGTYQDQNGLYQDQDGSYQDHDQLCQDHDRLYHDQDGSYQYTERLYQDPDHSYDPQNEYAQQYDESQDHYMNEQYRHEYEKYTFSHTSHTDGYNKNDSFNGDQYPQEAYAENVRSPDDCESLESYHGATYYQ